MCSLVPRPFKRRRRKGVVHTAHASVGISTATGHVTIVILCWFCMTCNSMDDKRRVYDSIQLPHFFLGSPCTCMCSVYQALSPLEDCVDWKVLYWGDLNRVSPQEEILRHSVRVWFRRSLWPDWLPYEWGLSTMLKGRHWSAHRDSVLAKEPGQTPCPVLDWEWLSILDISAGAIAEVLRVVTWNRIIIIIILALVLYDSKFD